MSRRTSKRSHTTYAGRIVYDRPKHKFTYSRAIRIISRVDWRNETLEDIMLSVGELQRIYLLILVASFERAGLDPGILVGAGGFALAILKEVRARIAYGLEWIWDSIKALLEAL